MDASTLLILSLIGLTAGVLGGMIGLGGGIILIPAMVFFLGLSQKEAQGTSIAIMLPPIGLLAAYNYYKAGYVNIKFAIVMALAFMVGGYFGSKLALVIPEVAMRRIFAGLLIVVAVKMMVGK